jgi:hypothetical protein
VELPPVRVDLDETDMTQPTCELVLAKFRAQFPHAHEHGRFLLAFADVDEELPAARLVNECERRSIVYHCDLDGPALSKIAERAALLARIIEEEGAYISGLQALTDFWEGQIRNANEFTPDEFALIFKNFVGMRNASLHFQSELKSRTPTYSAEVGDVFLHYCDSLTHTLDYFASYDAILGIVRSHSEKPEFADRLRELASEREGGEFGEYLDAPGKRMPDYLEYLGGLVALTPESHPDGPNVRFAARRMRELAQEMGLVRWSDANLEEREARRAEEERRFAEEERFERERAVEAARARVQEQQRARAEEEERRRAREEQARLAQEEEARRAQEEEQRRAQEEEERRAREEEERRRAREEEERRRAREAEEEEEEEDRRAREEGVRQVDPDAAERERLRAEEERRRREEEEARAAAAARNDGRRMDGDDAAWAARRRDDEMRIAEERQAEEEARRAAAQRQRDEDARRLEEEVRRDEERQFQEARRQAQAGLADADGSEGGFSPWIIGGIVAAVGLVAGSLYYVYRRRQSPPPA